eukprot:1452690-Pleurochrysis_carterae.AAC.1
MGAGVVECDVAVTKDGELVCRHSQCDLHTTTNILETELASKCRVPLTLADPVAGTEASAECCTSDLTLAEFQSLCGIMDSPFNRQATTLDEVLGDVDFRTQLYAETCAKLMTHKESIELINAAGRQFTPELKAYDETKFAGGAPLSYDAVRQKLIDEYVEMGVPVSSVWPQSFVLDDIYYWIANTNFGDQAVALFDGAVLTIDQLPALKEAGVKVVAPPMQDLVAVSADSSSYVASALALEAKQHFQIITWTLERSGPLSRGGGWYYGTSQGFTDNDGDALELTHVLAQE